MFTSKIYSVAILLGSTILTPKEIYLINLTYDYTSSESPSQQILADSHRKLVRTLVTSNIETLTTDLGIYHSYNYHVFIISAYKDVFVNKN